MDVVHRDLTSKNILIGPNKQLKIASFGLAQVGEGASVVEASDKSPFRWMAPESLTESIYTKKSDVWEDCSLLFLFECPSNCNYEYAGIVYKSTVFPHSKCVPVCRYCIYVYTYVCVSGCRWVNFDVWCVGVSRACAQNKWRKTFLFAL